jgi:hypothetical protein
MFNLADPGRMQVTGRRQTEGWIDPAVLGQNIW